MHANQLLPEKLRLDAGRRIFCFPHAGGGTAMFYRWQRFLPNDCLLAPLRLPGREDRLNEDPYRSLNQLADDAATAISTLEPQPYALVGHSLGGYVALEVSRRLLDAGYLPPAKLVVAACGAPRVGKATNPIGHLPDDEFVDEVSRRYDGIPQAVREHRELLAMVLPALRADIQMIESYENPSNVPLPIDITALGGTEDVGAPAARLNDWRTLTTERFTMRLFPGGHFFLHPPTRRNTNTPKDAIPAPLAAIIGELPPAEGDAT